MHEVTQDAILNDMVALNSRSLRVQTNRKTLEICAQQIFPAKVIEKIKILYGNP